MVANFLAGGAAIYVLARAGGSASAHRRRRCRWRDSRGPATAAAAPRSRHGGHHAGPRDASRAGRARHRRGHRAPRGGARRRGRRHRRAVARWASATRRRRRPSSRRDRAPTRHGHRPRHRHRRRALRGRRCVPSSTRSRSTGPTSGWRRAPCRRGRVRDRRARGRVPRCGGRRVPAVIDGLISGAAALVATGHRARRARLPHRRAPLGGAGPLATLEHLRLQPLLDLGLRLGEGTGAALGMTLCVAACAAAR